MRPITRSVASALCAVALAGSLTGCQTAKEAQASVDAKAAGGAKAGCPVTPDPSVRAHVRIAYQLIPNGDLVVKNRHLLETCLPKATISWAKFDSGGDVVQAFGSNSADIGLLGSSPATKALSAPLNIPIKVVWVQDVIGAAESLVARQATVKSLADLKGKKIGVPFGSTSHYSLVLALQQAGMTTSDVTLINLSPDKILAAWKRNDIDAAWVWDPTLSQIKASGHTVMSSADTAAKGASTYDLSGGRAQFVDANPAFMKMWTALEDQGVKAITDHPQQAAQNIAAELGIPTSQVIPQFKGYTYLDARKQASSTYAGGGLGKDLLGTARFLLGQGDITKVSPASTYTNGVYAAAIKEVAK